MFVTFWSSCGFALLISIMLCGSGGTACLLVGLVPSVMFLFGQRLVVIWIKIWETILITRLIQQLHPPPPPSDTCPWQTIPAAHGHILIYSRWFSSTRYIPHRTPLRRLPLSQSVSRFLSRSVVPRTTPSRSLLQLCRAPPPPQGLLQATALFVSETSIHGSLSLSLPSSFHGALFPSWVLRG